MIGFIIGGAVLIALGAVLLLVRRRNAGHLLEIKFLETTPVPELITLAASVREELGTGGFRQLVETRGTVTCDEPVEAELSGEHVAYYRMQVEERFEETYTERDGEGREVVRTRTGSTTVANNTRSARFQVAEGGGAVTINPDGAKLDLHQTLDHFEPSTGILDALTYGGFTMPYSPGSFPHRRILGYHYAEWVLPVNATVFVVGQASDTGGELVIGRPTEKEKPFIVSLKSEEEVTRGMESKGKWLMIGAIASFAIGAGLIVMGIVRAKH